MDTYFTIDTLLQGFITVFFLILGGIIFFTNHLEDNTQKKTKKQPCKGGVESKSKENLESKENTASEESISWLSMEFRATFVNVLKLILGIGALKDLDNDLSKYAKAIISIVALAVLVFVMGIFGKTSSDHWMNKGNISHFGNKIMWANPTQIYETSSKIRESTFRAVYSQELDSTYLASISKENINRHYYFTKHEILHNPQNESRELYKFDVENTIAIIEYSQVFTLSFFILYVFSWLNLISIQVRSLFNKEASKEKWDLNFENILYRFCILFCFSIIISGILNALGFIPDFLPGEKRKWYFFAVNSIPVIVWVHLWIQSRKNNNGANLFRNKAITYRRLFIKHYYTIIFLYAGLIGYLVSSNSWIESERTKHLKIYGMYKNIDEEFSTKHNREMNELFLLTDSTNKKRAITE